MTIRLKLLASITFLGGLLIAILIVNAINHANTYIEDLKAGEINEAADLLVASAGAWAVERGTSSGLLGNPSKASDKQIQTIKNKRIEGDESFKKALEIIEFHGSGLLEADLRAVRKDHNEIVRLRKKIDIAIGSRDNKDFTELRKASFKAFTNLIVDSQKLRVHEEEQLGNNVPLHVALAFSIRHNLWITSEYSGRERGMVAGMIGAGEQFPPEMLRILGNFRGHVETGWENAFQLKDELSTDFNAELKKVQKIYFQDFTDVRSKVISAGTSGQDYPVSAAKWFEEATKGIQSLLSAQKIAKKDIQEHIEHALSSALIWLIFDLSLLAIALVCFGFVIFVVLRQVVQPLEKIRYALAELSKGNFEVFVPDIEGHGEMVDMSRAVYKFKQESRAAERYREEQSTFRKETREKHQKQIRSLADQFEDTVGGVIDALSSSSSQLSSTSTEVSQIANRTATKSSSVREAANEAGSEIEAVSGSVDEVNQAISEVSVTVSNTNKLTEEASSHASEASERVAALNAASAKINDIVSLISEIAEQTNLLALNATIEAARAGDAGKGFAVVANEVKSLASQTQKATVEIGSQVENMLLEITNSTKAVDLIADAVNQTNSAMTKIADAVDKQSENSQHVADASRIALEKVKSVITDIVSVTEDAASTGGATEELQASASELSRNSKLLAEETESFIGRIRVDKEEEAA